MVECDPFHGNENETVVAYLTKLNHIATLFSHDEKILLYYILKLFPFSLKGDAKIWYNTISPHCVRSPQDKIYYLSENIFLLIRNKLRATATEILLSSLELALVFPLKRKGRCSTGAVSISLSLRTKVSIQKEGLVKSKVPA